MLNIHTNNFDPGNIVPAMVALGVLIALICLTIKQSKTLSLYSVITTKPVVAVSDVIENIQPVADGYYIIHLPGGKSYKAHFGIAYELKYTHNGDKITLTCEEESTSPQIVLTFSCPMAKLRAPRV